MAFTLLLAVVALTSSTPLCAALEGDVNDTANATASPQKADAVEAAATSGADEGNVSGIEPIRLLADKISQMPWVGSGFVAHEWVYSKATELIRGGAAPTTANLVRAVQEPAPVEMEEQQHLSPTAAMTHWAVKTIVIALFGIFCYSQKKITGVKKDPIVTMDEGHFGCLSNAQVCCCALCCPALRWADTITMSGVAGDLDFGTLSTFWVLFAAYSVMSLLDGLFFLGCTAVLLTYYRQKLRAELTMEHCTCPIMCCDFLYALCCTCCLISQEARAVNEMVLVGRLVVVETHLAPVVGAPVYGAAPPPV